MKAIDAFLIERNAALASLDMSWARKKLPHASNDDVLLAAMHKARYECLDINDQLRHVSARWLRAHGYTRLGGLPLLPEGELPV